MSKGEIVERRPYSSLGAGLAQRSSSWIRKQCVVFDGKYAHAEMVEPYGGRIVTRCRVQRLSFVQNSKLQQVFAVSISEATWVADGRDNVEAEGPVRLAGVGGANSFESPGVEGL